MLRLVLTDYWMSWFRRSRARLIALAMLSLAGLCPPLPSPAASDSSIGIMSARR